jgi:hypothetical protein
MRALTRLWDRNPPYSSEQGRCYKGHNPVEFRTIAGREDVLRVDFAKSGGSLAETRRSAFA